MKEIFEQHWMKLVLAWIIYATFMFWVLTIIDAPSWIGRM